MTAEERNGHDPSLLTALLNSSSMALVSVDLEGTITHWTQGATRLFGFSAREMLGQHWSKLAPQKLNAELQKSLSKIVRGRTLPEVETRRLRKDASEFDAQFGLYPITGSDGESIVGALSVTTDITARKQAEAELAESAVKIQAIVQTVLDGIITIDEEGIIDAINPAAQAIFGYHPHEVIGHNVSLLMPEPFRSEHDQYIRNYLETGVPKIIGIGREVQGMRKNGDIFPLELSVSAMRVHGRQAFVGVVKDISERKQQEQALHEQVEKTRKSNRKLEQTLNTLRETQNRLIESEKMASLGSLVAGVAHEINTPIGISVTAASYLDEITRQSKQAFLQETLRRSDLTHFFDSCEESSELILNNLNRASHLIKSFKAVAVDQSHDEDREINLGEYLGEIVESLTPELKRAHIAVDLDCPDNLVLTTNPGALYQVVSNLLMNTKHHAYADCDGGRVAVHVKTDDEEITIAIRDWGAGITDKVSKHIFEPFFTTRRTEGGTGLGLHLTYNLVAQSLGGSIDLETEAGEGSCFFVKIPIERYPTDTGSAELSEG